MDDTLSSDTIDVGTPTPNKEIRPDISADDLFDSYDAASEEDSTNVSGKSNSKSSNVVKAKAPNETKIFRETKGNQNDKTSDQVKKESEENQEDQEKITATPQAEKTDFKVYKGKDGDQEITISPDATFTFKADGKDVTVRFEDLQKNFSGKVAWDKRFSELDRERRGYQAQRDQVVANFKQIEELATTGSWESALSIVFEMAGKDPVDGVKTYVETLGKAMEEFKGMSQEQRDLYWAKKKLAYQDKKLGKERAAREWEMGLQKLQQEVDAVQQELGIDREGFKSLYQAIKKLDSFANKEPTPTDIKTYYNELKLVEKVEKAVEKVSPELLKNDNLIDEVCDWVANAPFLREEDVVDIVKAHLGINDSIENLNKKVQKATSSGQRATNLEAHSKVKEPMAWDEL